MAIESGADIYDFFVHQPLFPVERDKGGSDAGRDARILRETLKRHAIHAFFCNESRENDK
jgi:hypothetical protein